MRGIYTKIKGKKIILSVGLLGGIVWNLLSLLEVIPLSKWNFSFKIVAIVSLITLFLEPPVKASKRDSQVTANERQWTLFALLLSILWLITVIACIVYPL